MKSVHSHVLSSDPISLSDATSFLSSFNNSVCGGGGGASVAASHETCWFIRRALASFEELEQLHRKLKDRKSDPKSQNDDVETTVGDNPPQSFVSSRDVTSKPRGHRHGDVTVTEPKVRVEEGSEITEVDKKKKEKGNIGNISENGDGESEMGEVKREKKKKKKKKRDNVDENVGEIKEEKKKRKSEVLENGEVDVSGEKQEKKKKKKRRKS